MRSYNPDEIDVQFDDERLVADAGLILLATLAVGLSLRELLDGYVDLGEAPGRANVADKAMTLLHSALAGGQWIDDCDRLRAGATGQVLGHGCSLPPPSARSCAHSRSAMTLGQPSWLHDRADPTKLDQQKESNDVLGRAVHVNVHRRIHRGSQRKGSTAGLAGAVVRAH